MEPDLDKDLIIKLIQDIMEDQKLRSLTDEEISVLIFEHVVLPLSKEIQKHYSHIAWTYSPYPAPISPN